MLELKNKTGRKRHLNLRRDKSPGGGLQYFYSCTNYSVAHCCCVFPCRQLPFLPPACGCSVGSRRLGRRGGGGD